MASDLIRLPAGSAEAALAPLVPAGWQTAAVLPLPGYGVGLGGHTQSCTGARPEQADTAIVLPAGQRVGPTSTQLRPLGQRTQLGAGAERISQRCKWKEQVGLRQVPTARPLSRDSRVERVMPDPRPATPIWERRQALLWSSPDPLWLSLTL